jgi:hypothetical protein
LPELAAAFEHGGATNVGPVVTVLQVVVVQPLPPPAEALLQEATPVGPVVMVGQVVLTQLFPEVGPETVQLLVPVGPVVTTGQLVAV